MNKRLRHIIACTTLTTICGCTIQPPLHLADRQPQGSMVLGEVVTEINVIWDVEDNWRDDWWYGWDDRDIALWGEIAYPMPSNYEGRFYALGEEPDPEGTFSLAASTIYQSTFRRQFDYGYHNMLVWSNIDSPDGTQALRIDESDPTSITATTSRTRVGFRVPTSRSTEVYNIPEIFYSGGLERFYISRDPEDYDMYDEVRDLWIKMLWVDLYPRVYIYLIQVAIYNNNGRVTDMNESVVVNSLADAVNLHHGRTSNTPVNVACEMRLKKDLPARDGRMADIFGGKMHTFGLCDMEPWSPSRSARYAGSRTDLSNHLSMNLTFANRTDSVYSFDITRQLREHAHGGVITIEIDADTLDIPKPPSGGGGGSAIFDPSVKEYGDSIEHSFDM